MECNTRSLRILIVDDHPAVVEGLRCLLEPEGITVCAEARNSTEAMTTADMHSPDLALVDLSLGDEDGVALIAHLGRHCLPSIAYSMHQDGVSVRRALAAGALGYVTKNEAHRVLLQAIFEVSAGRRFVSPKAAAALWAQNRDY